MKSRLSRLADLRQVVDYQFEKDTASPSDDPMDIVASNCCFSASAVELEFGAVRNLRPDVKRPYLHVSLSCPLGERLTRGTWAKVIRFVLDDVGLDPRKRQYIARRHARKELDHCHVIVNRVAIDGLVWSGEFEVWKFIKACQRAERKFELQLTVGLHDKSSNVPHQDRIRTADGDSIVKANRQSQRELGRVQNTQAMTAKLLDCAVRALNFQQFQKLALLLDLEVVEVVNAAWPFSGVVVRETWSGKSFNLSSVTSGGLNFRKLEAAFERNREARDSARGIEAADEDKQFASSSIRPSTPRQDRKRLAAMLTECAGIAHDFNAFRALALRRGIVVAEILVEDRSLTRILVREVWAREFRTLSSITRGRLDTRTLALELEENDQLSDLEHPSQQDVAHLDHPEEEGPVDPRDHDQFGDQDVDRLNDT